MLIGHYGPALLLQRTRPTLPLWTLFVAVQAVDVLWGVFILTGVEHARIIPGFTESNGLDLYDMPYTHSLVATLAWSTLVAVAWGSLRRSPTRWAEGLTLGVAVASHFAGDLLVHVPDLPVMSSAGAKWGLGLWRHRELALGVELAVFVLPAIWWRRGYWQPEGARRRDTLLQVMAVVLVASFYVPTPPAPWAMALTGLATYLAAARAAAWAAPDPMPAPRERAA